MAGNGNSMTNYEIPREISKNFSQKVCSFSLFVSNELSPSFPKLLPKFIPEAIKKPMDKMDPVCFWQRDGLRLDFCGLHEVTLCQPRPARNAERQHQTSLSRDYYLVGSACFFAADNQNWAAPNLQ